MQVSQKWLNMEKKMNRPNIQPKVRLAVWSAAGGRCSIRGCNKPLWYNGLTLMSGNFSDMAHIIGAKEDGPRGGPDSDKLATDARNIIIVCKDCHKEIDDNPEIYTVDILLEMKKEHEYRIDRVTGITVDQKTEVLIFKSKIAGRPVSVDIREVEGTIIRSGYYPASKDILMIDRTQEDGDGTENYWDYNRGKIEQEFKRLFDLYGQEMGRLSVFALGSMPFLFLLGKLITDTRVNHVEVFQRSRETQSWDWPVDIDHAMLPGYRIERPQTVNSHRFPVLLLALSDHIQPDKYEGLWPNETDVYTITLEGAVPNRDYLKHPSQVNQFVKLFHQLLNELQAAYGAKTTLHLLPAVPLSIAVRSGMAILPKKEMPILIYDMNWEFGGFRPIFLL